jgi:arylamine N-acetyltransferase
MKTLVEESSYFEFLLSGSDILVLVESTVDEVIIRTSRGGLSEERKAAFIRELANEGFIPDSYRWRGHVRWHVDPAWPWERSADLQACTFRLMAKLYAGAAAFWLGVMGLLFLSAAR